VPVGTALTFTYVVTNIGDATLNPVSVTDNTGLTITCPKTTLVPDRVDDVRGKRYGGRRTAHESPARRAASERTGRHDTDPRTTTASRHRSISRSSSRALMRIRRPRLRTS
jgi:hypothetical protein